MNGQNSMDNNINNSNENMEQNKQSPQNQGEQGQRMNNNGLRANSPMEQARKNSQRGFNSNPYINQNMGQNPYYNDNNMNNQMPNQNPKQAQQPSMMNSLYGSFDTSNFLKGAAIGAIGAYLLTNENAQKTIFKGVAKATEMLQAGAEEMKERFEDAKAEMDSER